MKPSLILCVLGLSLTAPTIHASQDLADKNGCSGCHVMSRKTVGPGIQQIAQKYAGQKDAQAKLFDKVKNGGGGAWHGVWGGVPMPPNSDVGDKDLNAILAWMLEQK